jgi:hypothetical protein
LRLRQKTIEGSDYIKRLLAWLNALGGGSETVLSVAELYGLDMILVFLGIALSIIALGLLIIRASDRKQRSEVEE